MVERKEGREAGLSHSEEKEGLVQMLWDGPPAVRERRPLTSLEIA